jgi:hypothetical protein
LTLNYDGLIPFRIAFSPTILPLAGTMIPTVLLCPFLPRITWNPEYCSEPRTHDVAFQRVVRMAMALLSAPVVRLDFGADRFFRS